MLEVLKKMYEAEIEKAKANINIYLENPVGIGEHSDIIETIQKELDQMAAAHDRLEMLNKYFND